MARAGTREWLGLAALLPPVMITSMDISVLYLAVPRLSEDLRPSAGELLWILDVYGFLLAGLLITMGNLGDRIGRRRLLMIGATVFGLASALAAFSTSPEQLIIARVLMGIGGSTLMPSTLSLIRNLFHDDGQRATAIGIWSAAFAGGSALGPVVGGVLLQFLPWGSVFLINLPVVLIMLIGTAILVPEYRHPRPDRLDPISVVLSIGAILPVVWAIKHAAERLALDGWTALALLIGIAAAFGFVRRQGRLATPLVDLDLIRRPAVCGSVIGGMMSLFALLGVNLYLSQYLQLVLGLDPLPAALWTLPGMITVAVGAVLSPRLRARVGAPRSFLIGFAAAAAGVAVLIFTPDTGGLPVIVAAELIFGFGLSVALTIATDLVVAAAPPDRAGAASAISETGNELGAALGVAVLGSVGTALYRAAIGGVLPPGLPGPVREAAEATLAGAVGSARELSPELAEAMITAARSVFVDSLSAVAVCGTVVLAALAVLIPRLVRRAETVPEEKGAADGGRSELPSFQHGVDPAITGEPPEEPANRLQ